MGQGYEECWPETWEVEHEEKVSEKLVRITKVGVQSVQYLTKQIQSTPKHLLPADYGPCY